MYCDCIVNELFFCFFKEMYVCILFVISTLTYELRLNKKFKGKRNSPNYGDRLQTTKILLNM